LASGLARQIANPALPAITEIGRQLEKVGERRSALEQNLSKLQDRGHDDADSIAARIRRDLESARDRLESFTTGAAINALVAELLGPSLVTPDGQFAAGGEIAAPNRKPLADRWCARGDDPSGIRTRVAAVKGPCPGPLDDGAKLIERKTRPPREERQYGI
jgi:hypothetical protein